MLENLRYPETKYAHFVLLGRIAQVVNRVRLVQVVHNIQIQSKAAVLSPIADVTTDTMDQTGEYAQPPKNVPLAPLDLLVGPVYCASPESTKTTLGIDSEKIP